MQNKFTPLEKKDRRQIMAEAVFTAQRIIQDGVLNNSPLARKEVAFEKVMQKFPALVGENCAFTGDNWMDDPADPKKSVMPYASASIALTQRDRKGNIIVAALVPVASWGRQVLIADGDGVWMGRIDEEMRGEFHCITEVDNTLLKLPLCAQIFGQKSSEHWVAMGSVIADLNKDGIRTGNDCGPFFGLIDWFRHTTSGVIMPGNIAYCEPYANKAKEEIMAFVVRSLNRNLRKEDRFKITDMSGRPLFAGKRTKHEGVDEKYASSGYVITPTGDGNRKMLSIMRTSVLGNVKFIAAAAGSKMRLLAEQLERFIL